MRLSQRGENERALPLQGRSSRPYLIALLSFLSSLPCIFFSDVRAEEVRLEVTVTTPTRLEEPLDKSPASVSVVTEQDIEGENPVTVSDLIRDTPGAEARVFGTIGEEATLRFRGAERFHTLVLIDGVRVNSPFRGFFDFGDLSPEDIEQVEIVRGAQSALYGSEAIGGVVNIKTKRGKIARDFSFKSEGGNLETFRETLAFRGRGEKGDYSLTLSQTNSEGQFERDEFTENLFSGRITLDITEGGSLLFISRYQRSKKEFGIDILEAFDPLRLLFDDDREQKRRLFTNSLAYRQRVFPWWNFSLQGSAVDSHIRLNNAPDTGKSPTQTFFEDTDERWVTVDFQNNFSFFEQSTLTAGMEYERDEVAGSILTDFGLFPSPIPFLTSGKRRNIAYYFQHLFRSNIPAVLQTGVRIDDNSAFGAVTNPKVSGSYMFQSTHTKIKGSWGRGFRAPSIQDLFFGLPVFGNPNLTPEKSKGYEIGIEQDLFDRLLHLEALFFHISFDSLIQRGPPPAKNIGKARSKGIEAALSARPFTPLQIKANYTFLDAEDRITKKELPFRSRHRWNIGFLFTPPLITGLILDLDISGTSSQVMPVDFLLLDGSLLTGRSPGFTVVDLAVSYSPFITFKMIKDLQLSLRINNLLDKDYQEVPGFPAPGINFLAGVKAFF